MCAKVAGWVREVGVAASAPDEPPSIRILWHYPDGSDYMNGYRCPDFIHSLDAQAKWLWPKLNLWEMGNESKDMTYFIAGSNLARAANPAEACAEAILSLIGEDE